MSRLINLCSYLVGLGASIFSMSLHLLPYFVHGCEGTDESARLCKGRFRFRTLVDGTWVKTSCDTAKILCKHHAQLSEPSRVAFVRIKLLDHWSKFISTNRGI